MLRPRDQVHMKEKIAGESNAPFTRNQKHTVHTYSPGTPIPFPNFRATFTAQPPARQIVSNFYKHQPVFNLLTQMYDDKQWVVLTWLHAAAYGTTSRQALL